MAVTTLGMREQVGWCVVDVKERHHVVKVAFVHACVTTGSTRHLYEGPCSVRSTASTLEARGGWMVPPLKVWFLRVVQRQRWLPPGCHLDALHLCKRCKECSLNGFLN
jgi:hypothetical protein